MISRARAMTPPIKGTTTGPPVPDVRGMLEENSARHFDADSRSEKRSREVAAMTASFFLHRSHLNKGFICAAYRNVALSTLVPGLLSASVVLTST